MEKETIIRKDGIVYERKKRTNKRMDKSMLIRFHSEEIEKIKEIAELKGIKTSTLVRTIIRQYLDNLQLVKGE